MTLVDWLRVRLYSSTGNTVDQRDDNVNLIQLINNNRTVATNFELGIPGCTEYGTENMPGTLVCAWIRFGIPMGTRNTGLRGC